MATEKESNPWDSDPSMEKKDNPSPSDSITPSPGMDESKDTDAKEPKSPWDITPNLDESKLPEKPPTKQTASISPLADSSGLSCSPPLSPSHRIQPTRTQHTYLEPTPDETQSIGTTQSSLGTKDSSNASPGKKVKRRAKKGSEDQVILLPSGKKVRRVKKSESKKHKKTASLSKEQLDETNENLNEKEGNKPEVPFSVVTTKEKREESRGDQEKVKTIPSPPGTATASVEKVDAQSSEMTNKLEDTSSSSSVGDAETKEALYSLSSHEVPSDEIVMDARSTYIDSQEQENEIIDELAEYEQISDIDVDKTIQYAVAAVRNRWRGHTDIDSYPSSSPPYIETPSISLSSGEVCQTQKELDNRRTPSPSPTPSMDSQGNFKPMYPDKHGYDDLLTKKEEKGIVENATSSSMPNVKPVSPPTGDKSAIPSSQFATDTPPSLPPEIRAIAPPTSPKTRSTSDSSEQPIHTHSVSNSSSMKRPTSPALLAASAAALKNLASDLSTILPVSSETKKLPLSSETTTLDEMKASKATVERRNPFDDVAQASRSMSPPPESTPANVSFDPIARNIHAREEEPPLPVIAVDEEASSSEPKSTQEYVARANAPASCDKNEIDSSERYQEAQSCDERDFVGKMADSSRRYEAQREKDDRSEISQSESDVSSRRPETDVGSNTGSNMSTGPLWKQAGQVAETEEVAWEKEEELREFKFQKLRSQAPPKLNARPIDSINKLAEEMEQRSALRKKKAQISQSLLARTRSRADVDTLVPTAVPSTLFRAAEDKESNGKVVEDVSNYPQSHGVINPQKLRQSHLTQIKDESALVITPKLARKRTKVVQLLVFGLLGIIGGFFGGIFTLSTCDFASAEVQVGDNNNLFKLHFGMWKYSPIDSVFQGYTYCYPYDEEYTTDAPVLSRIFGLIALVAGSFSLSVLWTYLILGVTREFFWKSAIYLFLIAGICQALTFLLFTGDICQRNSCDMGPGAIISLISTIVWFVVAYEMHHNAPISAMLPELPGNTRTNQFWDMEMPELHRRIKSVWNVSPLRAGRENIPSLFNFTQRNQADSDSVSSSQQMNGSYHPPSLNTRDVV